MLKSKYLILRKCKEIKKLALKTKCYIKKDNSGLYSTS